jgi:RND family efflux transporter MFP subunit
MKRIISISILALVLFACGQNTPEANQKKADALKRRIVKMERQLEQIELQATEDGDQRVYPVRVKALAFESLSRDIEFSANLQPWEEIYMAPASPGKITQIFVEVGDRVKKGQKLVKMDDTQLLQAKIQLESLRKDFGRLKTLRESGSVAEQQFDQMKTQLEVTEKNVKFLEENNILLAPFDGVITGKFFEDGELYSGAPNTQAGKAAIVTLQQINVLKASINVSEKYYSTLSVGTSVKVVSEVYKGEVFGGEISNIYPTINPLTRSFVVEIKIPNREFKLRPGMFSRVNIKLDETDALVVPAIAVIQQEGTNNRHVFINNNGLAKKVQVQVGQRFDENIEIVSDQLEAGNQLIVAGQAILMDNSKVKVIE